MCDTNYAGVSLSANDKLISDYWMKLLETNWSRNEQSFKGSGIGAEKNSRYLIGQQRNNLLSY